MPAFKLLRIEISDFAGDIQKFSLFIESELSAFII